ncbi:unnamed protein product [Ectocarpus sp. CCAP 1310/34]|nr:unnamed protein product [Ectocarpus sp. CCAP 1310/34]
MQPSFSLQTAAEGSNKYGQEDSNYPVLETFAERGILEVKIIVSTYHWGHVEMFLCNAANLPGDPDSTATQSCFNEHPLDRADDDELNGPVDPDNTGRFILDPPCRASEIDQEVLDGAYPCDETTARFKLPQGLSREGCVETDEPTYVPTPEGGEVEEGTDEPTPAPTAELEPATPMAGHAHGLSDRADRGDLRAVGGAEYEGSTCCRTGYDCVEMADCYSECEGLHWEGP